MYDPTEVQLVAEAQETPVSEMLALLDEPDMVGVGWIVHPRLLRCGGGRVGRTTGRAGAPPAPARDAAGATASTPTASPAAAAPSARVILGIVSPLRAGPSRPRS